MMTYMEKPEPERLLTISKNRNGGRSQRYVYLSYCKEICRNLIGQLARVREAMFGFLPGYIKARARLVVKCFPMTLCCFIKALNEAYFLVLYLLLKK